MSRLRTFIAVDVGKSIRGRLVALQERLAQSGCHVKWVEPDNLHVTMLFLGEAEDRQLPEICNVVAEQTARQSAFPMAVAGTGCFPNPHRPRILWAGIGQGATELHALHGAIELPLERLGFRQEDRPFTPHITLGRVVSDRRTADLKAVLAKQGDWKGGEIAVTELQIMSSELTPKGPLYTVLSRAKLRGDS